MHFHPSTQIRCPLLGAGQDPAAAQRHPEHLFRPDLLAPRPPLAPTGRRRGRAGTQQEEGAGRWAGLGGHPPPRIRRREKTGRHRAGPWLLIFSVKKWAVLRLKGGYSTPANRKRGSHRPLVGSAWLGVDTSRLDEVLDGSFLLRDRSSRARLTDGCLAPQRPRARDRLAHEQISE